MVPSSSKLLRRLGSGLQSARWVPVEVAEFEMKRIVVLCTVEAGIDTLVELDRLGVKVHAIVGLAPDARARTGASGWIDIRPIAERLGIKACLVDTYALDRPSDRRTISALKPDLILVLGWQRLVPAWLIALARSAVLGSHGSCDGITAGRGRSPQNWALMLQAPAFELALFKIAPGIDDGPVIATGKFHYAPQDDIRISYQRASIVLARMIADALAHPELPCGEPQSEGKAAYLPQRRAEDGIVDWMLPTATIAAHCRALTQPYPGLRAKAGESSVTLWEMFPFDDDRSLAPGGIGAVFVDGSFLIGGGDGRLLVRNWSADSAWQPRAGALLAGRLWRETVIKIVERHRAKHPDLPVSLRILAFLDD